MCGIIGIVGEQNVVPLLVDGLRRLEYRGYDSTGLAIVTAVGLATRRASGKLHNLATSLATHPLTSQVGIAHTRWATHGAPTEHNAHPHATARVAIVHNGIIENYLALRGELQAAGAVFTSETDSEVIAHLISYYLTTMPPQQAFAAALQRLHGAWAIAAVLTGDDDLIMVARHGSPLVIGYGDNAMYIGSDALALAPLTQRLSYLEEGDYAMVRRRSVAIFSRDDKAVTRPIVQTGLSGAVIGKGNYRHFMLKEIHEQPTVIGDTLRRYTEPSARRLALPPLPWDWRTVTRLTIVACGTAYYAGCVAKYWFEKLAHLPVEVDIASEFRYRDAPLPAGGVTLVVSQSGETADTLAALKHAAAAGQLTLAVVNVQESSMARLAHGVVPTLAGPEIGVASTKAFTTQLTVLACLALAAAQARGVLSQPALGDYLNELLAVPEAVTALLAQAPLIEQIAQKISTASTVLYLGRGAMVPLALEGALKLKEISYIHAEGFAAGEMKHGPIALIDENVPIIALAPADSLLDKTISNLQEAAARGGQLVLLSQAQVIKNFDRPLLASVALPTSGLLATPIVASIPVQLLAYYVAVTKGTDVDQPRNLAKSVTVE